MSPSPSERELLDLDNPELAERVFTTFPGGETGFWTAWSAGLLDDRVCEWVRRHAVEVGVEEEVARSDSAIERRRTRNAAIGCDDDQWEKRLAMEAVILAVPGPGRITDMVSGTPFEVAELRERIRAALFDLISEDLDIDLATIGSEAEIGTRLVRSLFHDLASENGDNPPASFMEIRNWLADFRRRNADPVPLTPTEALIRDLAGLYLKRKPDSSYLYQYEPSFRLFVRMRLKAFCRKEGWSPRSLADGGRFPDLDAAFLALTRQRIGAALKTVGWGVIEEWLEADAAIL